MDLPYRAVDADNHYYEPLDACTRHLDREYRRRGVQAVQEGTHTLLLAGGKLFRFIPNPTFDPIIVPGCMDLMFRGQIPEGVDPRTLMKVEPLRPEYRDRDARLAVMDEQGLEAVLLFPTLACGIEQALRDDIPATVATLRAFNRWLDEDWGFSYQRPDRHGADAVACRSRRRTLRDRLAARPRRAHGAPAPRAGPDRERPRAVVRRPRPRPGLGAPGRGAGAGRVPSRRQRLRDVRGGMGCPRLLRAVPRRRRALEARGVGPADPRHDRQHDRGRRVRPTPRRCGRRASRTAPTGCRSWPSGC